MFRPFSIRPSSGLTWWTKEKKNYNITEYIYTSYAMTRRLSVERDLVCLSEVVSIHKIKYII